MGLSVWRRRPTPFNTGCSVPTPKGDLGIHSMIIRKDSMIARHVARLVLGLDNLWSLMMKAGMDHGLLERRFGLVGVP